jgi:hypothetical protein
MKRNSGNEMVYSMDYSENERLLIRVLEYETDRRGKHPELQTEEGELGYGPRTARLTPWLRKPHTIRKPNTFKLANAFLVIMHADDSADTLKMAFTEFYDNAKLDELDLTYKNGKLGSRPILEVLANDL